MDNKYLTKLAMGKLPADAKNLARKLISKSQADGKPFKASRILNTVLKPSQPRSFGHDVLRARKVAERATKNVGGAGVRSSLQEKVAGLLKGRSLAMKVTNDIPSHVKAQGKDIGMISRMMDQHDKAKQWAKNPKGGTVYKQRLNLPGGYKGFIRASDKGVRSRLYKDD